MDEYNSYYAVLATTLFKVYMGTSKKSVLSIVYLLTQIKLYPLLLPLNFLGLFMI